MTQDIIETPVKASCNVPKCNKTLKNKKNQTSHMEKVQRVVTAISESPITDTVRKLFMADNEPSTQGDSTGAVNSPKVRSEGSYQCGVCGTGNKTNDGIKEHMKVHDNAITIAENHAIIEDDKEVAKELADFASVLEKDLASGEGDNLDQIRNMVNVDNIVDNLVDNAYRAMNPSREQAHAECV